MAIKEMKVSQTGIDFVKSFEGLSLKCYDDSVGKSTIGYGHLIKSNERFDSCIDEGEAEEILTRDLSFAEAAVNMLVLVPLAQNQFDALVSFTFNLGKNNLKRSTLLLKINCSDYKGAAEEFVRWNKGAVGGEYVPIPGLTRRRLAEKAMFLGEGTPP